ncbi:hypothetical protein [Spirosoma daeguense]
MGTCLVRIEVRLQLIVASWPEPIKNQSRSIEAVATELISVYPFNPERLLMIEHFAQENRLPTPSDMFYLVRFTWENQQAKMPVRIPLSNQMVNQILSSLKTNS